MQTRLVAVLVVVQILGACGGPGVHGDEGFGKDSPFQHQFAVPPSDACEGAQVALLSQGYRIERFDGSSVRAHKDFQPKEEVNAVIDFDLTCKSTATGTIMFANAIETTYKLKKTSGATSLSVPGAGSISMPWSKSADSLVKVAETTISDSAFYGRFFDLVTNYLPKSLVPGRSGQQAKP